MAHNILHSCGHKAIAPKSNMMLVSEFPCPGCGGPTRSDDYDGQAVYEGLLARARAKATAIQKKTP